MSHRFSHPRALGGSFVLLWVGACNSSAPPHAEAAGDGSTPLGTGSNTAGATASPNVTSRDPPVDRAATNEAGLEATDSSETPAAAAGAPLVPALESEMAPAENGTDGSESRTGPSPGCSNGLPRAVSGHGSMTTNGGERSYELHVPAGGVEPRPLMLSLHGYTLSGTEQERTTGFSSIADREGFVVVYPNGLGSPTSWNAGPCCSYDDKSRDDLGFLVHLIDDLGQRLCLDQRRVYVTGFSNGGMMAYRMACQMADRIAAAASVSGSMVLAREECDPVRPVPFMHTHGTADPIVPYAGGSGPAWLTPSGETPQVFPSVKDEVALFAELNGCASNSETVFDRADTQCLRQSSCREDADVMMCTVTGGGHAWPGGADQGLAALIMGPQSTTLPTSEVMWEFLKGHELP